jgi:hypothetical protein
VSTYFAYGVQASTFSNAIFVETFIKELCNIRGAGNSDTSSNGNKISNVDNGVNNDKAGNMSMPIQSWHQEVIRQCSRNLRKSSSQVSPDR